MLAREAIFEPHQIRLPKELAQKTGFVDGDRLEVYEEDGIFYIVPDSDYPQAFVDRLEEISAQMSEDIASGKQKVYDNLDDLFAALDGGVD